MSTTTTTTTTSPDQLARAGVIAIEAYFSARGLTPVSAGDGRFTVYVPGGSGTQDLQLGLASTPAARGILVRLKARRTVAQAHWPKALLLANQWNRSSPLPQAVLAARGSGSAATGFLFVEGFLPPSSEPDPDQLTRFIDTAVAGARQFWSSAAVRDLTTPLPTAAPPAAADQQ